MVLSFKDLEFKEHPIAKKARTAIDKRPEDEELYSDLLNCKQAKIIFTNGVQMSVCFGTGFFSNNINTYEVYCSELRSEPFEYVTEEQVTELMATAQSSMSVSKAK